MNERLRYRLGDRVQEAALPIPEDPFYHIYNGVLRAYDKTVDFFKGMYKRVTEATDLTDFQTMYARGTRGTEKKRKGNWVDRKNPRKTPKGGTRSQKRKKRRN
ncbi:MAG: hypothetical protein JSW08_00625 [archaeon]|nr:MAG: hypothetical protein JSW08_00625 [archaeon]